MTISNTSRTAGPFIGNGATKIFPFTFKVYDRSDLLVAVTNTATSVETILVLDADYSVSINSDQNSNPGGTITTTVAPAVGVTLAATSNIGLAQTLDLTNQGGFYPRTINDALDRLTIMIQQLASKVGIGLNVGSAAALNSIVNFISNMASSAGSSLMGFIQAGAGAVLRTVQSKLRDSVSVKDFGAKGDGVTDDTTAIQAAIDSLGTSGGYVHFPPGAYLCSSTLTMRAKVTLRGRGCAASVLTWATTGDGIKMTSAINSSTAVNTTVENIGLTCTNGANTGGGYVDIGGSFVRVRNVAVNGFKYSTILDQTEIASISDCQFVSPITAGVWLTNGADHTALAAAQFTNRITIEKNQFNLCPISIIDDGGYAHHIVDNNFNAGTIHLRVAGMLGLTFDGNECEGASDSCVTVAGSTYNSGTGVGGCNISLRGNLLNPGANGSVSVVSSSGHKITSKSNVYTGSASAKVKGLVLGVTTFGSTGDSCISGPLTDVDATAGANTTVFNWGGGTFVQNGTTAGFAIYKNVTGGGGSEESRFDLQSNNNAGTKTTFARISSGTSGNAAGSESGNLNLCTIYNGTVAPRWTVIGVGQMIPVTDNAFSFGGAANRPTVYFAASSTINTSDEREKEQIQDVDAAALRAIRRVKFVQFKFRDAVAKKSDGARLHFGVIAQQVKAAFEAEGLDPFGYGVLCYDEWPEQAEVLGEDGNVSVPYRAAGNRYGVRHDELYALKFAALDAD